MKPGRLALAAVALGAVALSATNASWLAPAPKGRLIVVAHRGIAQPFDRDAVRGGCSARRIRPAGHNFIENTLFSMHNAVHFGARGFALDVQASADGHAVVFRDEALDCRTDGTGRVAERDLAYLKRLDVGHGYTADGRDFPLRGRGIGAMPTAAEVIRAFPTQVLIFSVRDAAGAEALVRAFREAGAEVGELHGFAGPPAALARLRRLTPAGFVLDPRASDACLAGYRRTGWLGLVPDACRGITLELTRHGGWTLWGWPYRFLDRMAGAGARFLILGEREADAIVGLEKPEQLGEVPRHYRGLLLIEDMYGTGRALQ